jgi:hypothetical protein
MDGVSLTDLAHDRLAAGRDGWDSGAGDYPSSRPWWPVRAVDPMR